MSQKNLSRTCAIAIAMSASVTVSMGELSTGTAKEMLRVTFDRMSTCKTSA